MRVELLIADPCPSCDKAIAVWKNICQKRDIDFSVIDIDNLTGRVLSDCWDLKTIPAVIIDGQLMGVGAQSIDEADELIARAHDGRH